MLAWGRGHSVTALGGPLGGGGAPAVTGTQPGRVMAAGTGPHTQWFLSGTRQLGTAAPGERSCLGTRDSSAALPRGPSTWPRPPPHSPGPARSTLPDWPTGWRGPPLDATGPLLPEPSPARLEALGVLLLHLRDAGGHLPLHFQKLLQVGAGLRADELKVDPEKYPRVRWGQVTAEVQSRGVGGGLALHARGVTGGPHRVHPQASGSTSGLWEGPSGAGGMCQDSDPKASAHPPSLALRERFCSSGT